VLVVPLRVATLRLEAVGGRSCTGRPLGDIMVLL
jgi:hypothetical protein